MSPNEKMNWLYLYKNVCQIEHSFNDVLHLLHIFKLNEWMNEWINEWMHKSMNEWKAQRNNFSEDYFQSLQNTLQKIFSKMFGWRKQQSPVKSSSIFFVFGLKCPNMEIWSQNWFSWNFFDFIIKPFKKSFQKGINDLNRLI